MSWFGRMRAALAGTGARAGKTDWWAVFIELMVVIVGILIAFELTEWDRRRQQRADEQGVLRQLSEEARADIVTLTDVKEQHDQSAENFALLIRATGDPAAAQAYQRKGSAGCNLLRLPAVRRHAAGGLDAADRTAIIEDGVLRHLIRRAEAERQFNDRQLDYFRASFDRYSAVIEPHMRWGLPGPSGERCAVDIAALRGDSEAVNLLPKLLRDQARFAEYRQRELLATRAVLDRAACLQTGNC